MTDKGRQLQPCPRQAFILRTADGGGLSCLFSRTHAKRNVEIPFQFSIEGKDIVFFAKKKKKRKGQETTKVFAARASSRLRFASCSIAATDCGNVYKARVARKRKEELRALQPDCNNICHKLLLRTRTRSRWVAECALCFNNCTTRNAPRFTRATWTRNSIQ